MSDSISKIYDDYDDYLLLCKKHEITPLKLETDGVWYNHFLELDLLERKNYE